MAKTRRTEQVLDCMLNEARSPKPLLDACHVSAEPYKSECFRAVNKRCALLTKGVPFVKSAQRLFLIDGLTLYFNISLLFERF